MIARETHLLTLLTGPRQFVIPIFQRDYSWTHPQCEQLLQDIIRVAKAPDSAIHFLGSLVYIDSDHSDAILPQWLVIDGQQRLTTCTLLLIALRDALKNLGSAVPVQDSPDALDLQYLQNPYTDNPALRAKLALRGIDNEWLAHLLLGYPSPTLETSRVPGNLEYLRERIEDQDPLLVLKGVRRLMIVSVALKAGQDNPQLIFESLNSTGLSLAQADLVRNYVLMGHTEQVQTDWYKRYWQPLEMAFGNRYRDLFDNFLRDFLTLEANASKLFKLDKVYQAFREWYPTHLNQSEHHSRALAQLQRMERFGRYYCQFTIGPAGSSTMEKHVARLRSLVDVAAPVVMVLYDCLDHRQSLSEDEFCSAIELLESYVFRRSVVGAESRSAGALFSTLAGKINRAMPLSSLKAQLARMGRGKEFPSDEDFVHALTTGDMYHRRNSSFMLSCMTNKGKEKIDLNGLTIEHVLPQKKDLADEWQEMLGEDWQNVQTAYLHRLGNLTLTAFNSEFQAKPFLQKRDRLPGGYADSPVWLNKSLARMEKWTPAEIEARGEALARHALTIWKALHADPAAIHQADLEDAISSTGDKRIEDVHCSNAVRELFLEIAAYANDLSEEVVELPNLKTVVYRTPAWFVELLPKASSIDLRLAVDAMELADISSDVMDIDAWGRVMNTAIDGSSGSMFRVSNEERLQIAKRLIQRTHELVVADE
jgi:predicted transport protein